MAMTAVRQRTTACLPRVPPASNWQHCAPLSCCVPASFPRVNACWCTRPELRGNIQHAPHIAAWVEHIGSTITHRRPVCNCPRSAGVRNTSLCTQPSLSVCRWLVSSVSSTFVLTQRLSWGRQECAAGTSGCSASGRQPRRGRRRRTMAATKATSRRRAQALLLGAPLSRAPSPPSSPSTSRESVHETEPGNREPYNSELLRGVSIVVNRPPLMSPMRLTPQPILRHIVCQSLPASPAKVCPMARALLVVGSLAVASNCRVDPATTSSSAPDTLCKCSAYGHTLLQTI